MIDYTLILVTNYSGTQWTLNGDSYEGLEWLDKSPKPTKEELDALWEETRAKVLANQQAYKANKKSALEKLAAIGLTAEEIKTLVG